MGSSSKSQTIGYKYFMAIHMGFARGPIDQIVELEVGGKQAWPIPNGTDITSGPNPPVGIPTVTDDTVILINAPELFGGDKGEGGIEGPCRIMMGKPSQVVEPTIKAALGGVVPDFRGVATAYFDGHICSLNPYPKPWKWRVRRHLAGWDGDPWYPETVKIVYAGGAIIAMNPAHMIYECATNRDWGRGFPRELIDDASFRRCADTLMAENIGLCMRYNRQSNLGEFVETVLNHIQGVIYTSRETGLITFDLIRDDYDPDDLPTFDYDTGLLSIEKPEIASREDVVNEIIVKYKDPITNTERSVRAHNLASIQTQGAKNSNTVEYPGAPTGGIAALFAARDLRVAANSGRRYTVILDRRAWRLIPGSVFRVSAPDKGIANLILRAGKITDPDIKDGKITITAVPDVFGLPKQSFYSVQTSQWSQPNRKALAPTYQTVREATYRDLFNALSRNDLDQVGTQECYAVAMATKPTNLSLNFSLFTKTTSENDYVSRDTDAFSPTFVISTAIGPRDTVIPFSKDIDGSQAILPCAGQLGGEILRIDAITYNSSGVGGSITVARGCVDTVPQAHAAQEPLILFDRFTSFDPREYAMSEVVQGKNITNTSSESLALADATTLQTTMAQRQGRPYGPGNVQINGASMFDSIPQKDDISVKFYHRNRIMLQDQLLGFFDASYDLEPGATYTIVFKDSNKTYRTVTGFTGSEYVYQKSDQLADGLKSGTTISVTLSVFRDGMQSRSVQTISVRTN